MVSITIAAFKNTTPCSLVLDYQCFTVTVKVTLVTNYETTWYDIPEYDSLNVQAQIS
jgi:hypothetical protein